MIQQSIINGRLLIKMLLHTRYVLKKLQDVSNEAVRADRASRHKIQDQD